MQSPFVVGPFDEAVSIAQFASTIPAYAREFAGVTVSADTWLDVPLLTKEQLIERVTEKDPYGDRLGVPPADLGWVFVAPGPMYMPFTESDMDAISRRFADTFGRCGLTSNDIVDQTTLYNWVVAATLIGKGIERVGATLVPGGSGDTKRHLEVIEALGVTALIGFPTFVAHLLDTAAAEGTTLAVKKAIVVGELHDPREKDRLKQQYGVTVHEYYGTADVGPVAVECAQGSGMHLREDVFVEFHDPSTGTPSTEVSATRPAELVVTDPYRRAMPIVRLRTGDLVDSLATGTCACGLSTPRIGRIVGRVGDITKVKGMFVVPSAAKRVLATHGILARHQLVVTRANGRDSLTLRVEGDQPSDWAAILGEVSQALRVQCDFEFVAAIEGDKALIDTRAGNLV